VKAKLITSAVLLVLLTGCGRNETSRTANAHQPTLSVQEIMDSYVDPNADALWGSVGAIETATGTENRQPQTDDEWRKARGHAVSLVEGAALLAAPRPVGANGHGALADAATPGIRTAVEIQAQIRQDPARFAAAAERLQHAGDSAVAAIGAKNPKALLQAGAEMDAACEACHSAYWYPRTPPLVLPSTNQFARIALGR
jgi:hypothetical protein